MRMKKIRGKKSKKTRTKILPRMKERTRKGTTARRKRKI